MSIFKKATIATVLGATTLAAASPAMADPYYGYHRDRGGDTTGAAIAGGIIGLALGAIVASSVNNHHDRYADRGWQYRDGYYWDRNGNRYDRDGRRFEDRRYYQRRGYDDRGYYGRDDYYGQRTYRYGY